MSAKGSRPMHRSVSMEHLSTVKPFSIEEESRWATENAAGRCAASTLTPEILTTGLTSHPAVTSSPSEQPKDILTGERMDEDAASNFHDDQTDDDDAGGCWKTVMNKRRARKMNAHTETEPSENIPGVAQRNVGKHSGNQQLPRLPLHDEKIILRPHGGLCLDKWTRPELAGALWSAACVIQAPDNSCKGIVPGRVPGTSSSTLVDELVAPETQILQARMMGQTNIALVTFEGLKVPRYVRLYGAELRCYPHRPHQLVCKICHKLGHRDDHCPTPHVVICPTCGTVNPTPLHPCTPHCKSCDGAHPTTDPNCPRRKRQAVNKVWVRKALEKEQRQLQPSIDPTASNKPAETRQSRPPTKKKEPLRSKSQATGPGAEHHQGCGTSGGRLGRGSPTAYSTPQSLPNSSPHTTTSSTPDPLAEIARLRRDMEARCERLQKQMDALVADMGASMQAALDRIERRMEALQIEIMEQVQLCIERTLARNAAMQSTEINNYSVNMPLDQTSRPSTSNAGTRRPHPCTRPSISSRDEDGAV
ncbi:hypothetical protein HPB52_011741 [Rhipicephalus sanguineus]|uniref:Uncharacterized protein n=1 Tax=Rhipicephalus sanguineus TaxID=34632 RepID=A0A9D4PKJ3_RHISA|nr:hypothetical protein HPB52_011741 [Rhipicephalus sanguineus]